jgi:hypothetical protein
MMSTSSGCYGCEAGEGRDRQPQRHRSPGAHHTQPGLSKWLKELEEDVGATLFERHARGLPQTPAGGSVVPYG